MTVRELIDELNQLPDDAEVIAPETWAVTCMEKIAGIELVPASAEWLKMELGGALGGRPAVLIKTGPRYS